MIHAETITELIIKILLYRALSQKEIERLLRKYQISNTTSSASIKNTLYRLKKKNLVTKTSTGWSSTPLAESVLAKKNESPKKFKIKSEKGIRQDEMIVMYDIPENLKKSRNRLREALKTLCFKQKQKSVWIGPAPLPKEFINYLSELKIGEYINFFRVKEEDIV